MRAGDFALRGARKSPRRVRGTPFNKGEFGLWLHGFVALVFVYHAGLPRRLTAPRNDGNLL
jgi:hypothetical protein